MSSLMQFRGKVDREQGKVGLEFYLVDSEPWYRANEVEPVTCALCGRQHPQLYRAYRKPAGVWGAWVVFRYNGEEHVPDLSTPIAVTKLPRGSYPVEDNDAEWHKE